MKQSWIPSPRTLLAPAMLMLLLFGMPLARGFSHYALGDLAVLALLYATLSTALHSASLGLARLAAPLGLLASFGVGAVLVWQVRELGLAWLTPLGLALFSLLAGLIYFFPLLLLRRGVRAGRALGVAALAALGSAVLLVGSFQLSNTLRWQLLNQHRLLGTPAYYLMAHPSAELRDRVWEDRVHRKPPPAEPPPAAIERHAPAPHIVFVLIDTLRADVLQVYGAERSLLPRLDAFAEGSVVFQDVQANASWTRPSVASFFTGLLPEEHGAVDRFDRLAEGWYVLAERVRDAGYQTAAFVSNYGAVGRDAGFDQGFDTFEQLDGGMWPYARAERVNASLATWLRRFGRQGPDQPVFLYLHYLDPHGPYLETLNDMGASPLNVREARLGYDAELRYLDTWLGKLFEILEQRLPGPRLVFLTSDHGEEFGEHGKSGHGRSLYNEVVRLPALLAGSEAGAARVEARLEARDFFDLLQQLARDPSFDPIGWAARRDRSRRYLSTYSETPAAFHRPYNGSIGLRGLEEDGFFLIWSAYGDTWELYDRNADPGETRNIVGQHPERVRELSAAMEESVGWWAERQPMDQNEETLEMLKRLGYIEE